MRADLIKILETYTPENIFERPHVLSMLYLLKNIPRCYYRDCFEPGHMSAMGAVVSHDYSHVLMLNHPHLKIWNMPGGHADGNEDLHAVAVKEVEEETGLKVCQNLEAIPSTLFWDIDCLYTPENLKKAEPRHLHYDVGYLFRFLEPLRPIESPEGLELRWLKLEEALETFPTNGRRYRVVKKIQSLRDTQT